MLCRVDCGQWHPALGSELRDRGDRIARLVDDMLLRLPRDLQAVIGSPQW